MNTLGFNVCPSPKVLFALHKDSELLHVLDTESLSTLKTFADSNRFSRHTLAVSEPLRCFLTYGQRKTVFAYWHFSSVGSPVPALQTRIYPAARDVHVSAPTGGPLPLRQSGNQTPTGASCSTTPLMGPCCTGRRFVPKRSQKSPFRPTNATYFCFVATENSMCTTCVGSKGKLYGVLLDGSGSWDDCYLETVAKTDAHIIDFCLGEIHQDTFIVATNKSVWLHRLGGGLTRVEQGLAL